MSASGGNRTFVAFPSPVHTRSFTDTMRTSTGTGSGFPNGTICVVLPACAPIISVRFAAVAAATKRR